MEKDPSIGFACLPVNNTKLASTWDRRKNFHSLMDRSTLIFCGMSIFQHNPSWRKCTIERNLLEEICKFIGSLLSILCKLFTLVYFGRLTESMTTCRLVGKWVILRLNRHATVDKPVLAFFLIFPMFTGTYHDIYTIDFFTCVKFKQNVDEYLS